MKSDMNEGIHLSSEQPFILSQVVVSCEGSDVWPVALIERSTGSKGGGELREKGGLVFDSLQQNRQERNQRRHPHPPATE